MTERLLQFIWQFQYFNKKALFTEQGDALRIISQGHFNTNQGPDFTDGRIVLGETTWAGNIELHLNASDWHRHSHGSDHNYHNIILHVVWHNDEEIKDGNGAVLPALHLSPLVPKVLLQRYEWLMLSQDFVPCQQQLPMLTNLGWLAWKERLAVERLQQKAAHVLQLLTAANNHWEEVFWWILARNFGIKVNTGLFESIAQSIPVNLLAKHKNQIHQLEALLLGQAGLLTQSFAEDYPIMLQREYQFLAKKYQLVPISQTPHFLRMRPANFPTVRLAQLAMLVHQSTHLFSTVKDGTSIASIIKLFTVTANDYWHYHYRIDEPAEYNPKQLGAQTTANIIINTVVPVLFAYGLYNNQAAYQQKALQWLAELSPETNNIIQNWKTFGVPAVNALETQALIQLKNEYCNLKHCLNCSVGNALLKSSRQEV